MSEGKEKSKSHFKRKVVLKIIAANLQIVDQLNKIRGRYPEATENEISHFLEKTLKIGFIVLNKNGSYSVTEKGKSVYLTSTNKAGKAV